MALRTETATAPRDRRWIALAVIVAAQFMVVLDVAIVNVALPSIKTDLHFTQSSLQWVVTAYAIMFGGVLLLGGRMADLLGRRRLFMAGLALFTVSSLLDGLAWSEGSLIAFRSLQGLGAALLAPAALSILTTMFAEGRERNIALGIWGAVSGSGALPACCSAARSPAGSAGPGSSSSTFRSASLVARGEPAPPAREPGRARSPPLRRRRRRVDNRRADAAGLRDDTGGPARLGHGRDDRAAGRLGGSDRRIRRDRAALERAAPADADLPAAHAHGVERRPGSCSAARSSPSSSC